MRPPACMLWLASFGLALAPVEGGAVTVSVDPPDTSLSIGDEFVVRLRTDAFPDLKGFKLAFPYDATRLLLLSVTEGEVLSSAGGAYAAFPIPDVAAPADTFGYDAAMLEGATAGPGVLVYVRFRALDSGDAAIACGAADFRDSFNQQTVPDCAGAVVHIGPPWGPRVRISQVYGGGGDPGATYRNDYVELFNAGGSTADVTGWTVQYGPADGSTWEATTLSGTIPPGGYYLVQEAQGAGGGVDLPAPDAIGSIAMSATSGKVALVAAGTALSGACPMDASVADLVGYGAANCAEAAPGPAPGETTAAFRDLDGCEDTDDNLSDFVTLAPAPRHSSSPINVCSYWVSVDRDAPVDDLALGIVPHPARGPTLLSFVLPRAARAHLRVYDLQGRVVATVVDGDLPAGRHQVAWTGMTAGGPARSGVYFVRLQAAGLTLQRTLVLAR